MDMKALKESLRKKHYLCPIKIEFSSFEKNYVLLDSRNIKNGVWQYIYFEVENEERADEIIKKLAKIINLTKDKYKIGPLRYENYYKLKEKPKKIEAGFYEYRGYEIMDEYNSYSITGPVVSKKDRWVVKEKPWLSGKYFSGFGRLKDA